MKRFYFFSLLLALALLSCSDGDYYDLNEVIDGTVGDGVTEGSVNFKNTAYPLTNATYASSANTLTFTGPSTNPNATVLIVISGTLAVGDFPIGVLGGVSITDDTGAISTTQSTSGTLRVVEVSTDSIRVSFTIITDEGTATGTYTGSLTRQ